MDSELYKSDEDAILEEIFSSEDWEVEIQFPTSSALQRSLIGECVVKRGIEIAAKCGICTELSTITEKSIEIMTNLYEEFCEHKTEEKLMKKFSQDARSIACTTGLSTFVILKCFDAIPLIFYERIDETETESTLLNEDLSKNYEIIRYIGGFIIRKLIGKPGISIDEKLFLQNCIVNKDSSHLLKISEPFFQILLILERSFRENRSVHNVHITNAMKCVTSAETSYYINCICGKTSDFSLYTTCMQKVARLFFKIRGHRHAAKNLAERLTAKAGLKNKALRKQLKIS